MYVVTSTGQVISIGHDTIPPIVRTYIFDTELRMRRFLAACKKASLYTLTFTHEFVAD